MLNELKNLPINPVPEGALVTTLTAADGVKLRAARWLPPAGVALKGTICLFQGRTEFIEKYFETIEDLRKRGFAVATLDWRGQGGSERLLSSSRKGYVRNFDDFQQDVDVFMTQFALPDCPGPLYLLAHSMGGAIAVETLRRRPNWFDRAVLSSPMLGLAGFFGSDAARLGTKVLNTVGLGRFFVPGGSSKDGYSGPFEGNVYTGDAQRYKRVAMIGATCPELVIGSATLGWVNAVYDATKRFENADYIAQIRTPVLVMVAGDEGIVDNYATARFTRRLRTARAVTLDGAHHEILMETDGVRAAFFAAFDAFIPGTEPFPG